MGDTKNEVTSFKCRKCRQIVFSATNLSTVRCSSTSAPGLCDDDADLRLTYATTNLTKLTDTDFGHCQKTLWYLEEDSAPNWINNAIEKALFTKGKLNCPKCNGRLGAFDFIARRRCLCGCHLIPVIHIARNRVDPVCAMTTVIEKRPESTCNHKHDVQNMRRLAQAEHSESAEVYKTKSDAFDEESVNLGVVLPVSSGSNGQVPCNKVCKRRRSHVPSSAICAVTDCDVRSFPASAASGHSSRSLPIVMDRSSGSLPAPTRYHATGLRAEAGVVDTTQMTEIEENDNQFSVLAPQDADPETISPVIQTELSGTSRELVDQLTCAVCLCIFHEPHSCEPCGHVFCSSCLRRLCAASMIDTRCPLCRCIIQRCFIHHEFSEDIKRLFPDEVSSRVKSERKSRIGRWPLPGGQTGIGRFLQGQRYVPGQRNRHYFMTSVCLVLLLIMITFTIIATTVGVVVVYFVELFVDVGVELFDDVNWFVNYATQMLVVFYVEGAVPQELSKLWLGRIQRIIHGIARIANRTVQVDESNASCDEHDMNEQRGIHTSYYTQYVLSKMAQANAVTIVVVSCLGIFLVYKLLQRRRLF